MINVSREISKKNKAANSPVLNNFANMKTIAVDEDFYPIRDFTKPLKPKDYYICEDMVHPTLMVICSAA